MTTISIPDPLAGQLRAVADEIGTTLETCVKDALEHFLEERENAEDLRDAQEALERYRRNPESAVTMDEVLRKTGFTREELR